MTAPVNTYFRPAAVNAAAAICPAVAADQMFLSTASPALAWRRLR